MAWIVEKLAEIIMEAISILLSFLAMQLIDVYKMDGRQTLNYFFAVFNGNTDASAWNGSAGVFGGLYRLFLYGGLALIFLGMLYNLYKAFFGPMANAEVPTKTVFKAVIFAMFTAFSQSIVAFIFDLIQIPYDAISNGLGPGLADNVKNYWASNIENTASSFNITDITSFLPSPLLSPRFYSALVSIMLFMMLFKQFMMLVLEMAERYLMLGLLAVIAPICIACGAVRATEDVFKNWLSWMINACVVMCMNTFFLAVFICYFKAQCNIPYLLMWIAWIKTGQKIDEHMNALGLKTAKTGGFGQDVMGALHASLPMVAGIGDKFVPGQGGRMRSLIDSARTGRRPAPGFGFSKNELREGPKERKEAKTAAGKLVNNALKKADNAAVSASRAASSLTNKAKEKMGLTTGAGKRTGISHDELGRYLSGEKKLPPQNSKAYNDVAKDLLDMKAGKDANGKSLSEQLEDKGYKMTDINQRGDKTSFTAEDGAGNKISGTIQDGKAEEGSGSISMKGDDGNERSLSMNGQQNPDSPNPVEIGDVANMPKDDRQTVATAGNENMQESGEVASNNDKTLEGADSADFNNVEAAAGEKIDADNVKQGQVVDTGDGKYALSEPDENGVITGTNVDDPSDTKSFKQNEDGSLTDLSTGESIAADNVQNQTSLQSADGSTYTANGGPDANGNITATNENGDEKQFHQNADGSFSEISAANDVERSASFTDGEGNQWTLSGDASQPGMVEGTDKDGNKAMFSVDGDGNIHSTTQGADGALAAGAMVAAASDVSNDATSAKDADGNQYSLSKNADGTYTGTAADGSQATFAESANGGLSKVGENIGANNVSSNASTLKDGSGKEYGLSKNADGSFTGTAADGSTAQFTQNADGSMTKTSESSNVSSSNVSRNNQDLATQASAGGVAYNLKSNGDGTYTGRATDGSGQTATFSENGDKSLSMTKNLGDSHQAQNSMNNASITDSAGNTFSNLKSNGDGTYTGTTSDGKTANFTPNGDGSMTKTGESRQYDTSKGFETKSTPILPSDVKSSNGHPEAITANGQTYDNLQQVNGNTFIGKTSDGQTAMFKQGNNGEMSMQQTFATDTNGNKFQVSDSALTVNATRNSDGSVTTMDGTGRQKTMSAQEASASGYSTTLNGPGGSFQMDASRGGFDVGVDNGRLNVGAYSTADAGSENASRRSVSDATVSMGGYNFNANTAFETRTDSNGNISYQGKDINGQMRNISPEQVASASVSAGTTSAAASGAVEVSNAGGSIAHMSANPSYSDGFIAKSSDGSFFRAESSQRYDEHGRADANGSYLQTRDSNGVPRYVEAELTAGGNIMSYEMKPEARQIMFKNPDNRESREYLSSGDMMASSQSFREHTETNFQPANPYSQDSSASMVAFSNGNVQSIPEEDRCKQTSDGRFMSQRYVRDNNGNDLALDMSRCQFEDNGRLAYGSDVYVDDGRGNSVKMDYGDLHRSAKSTMPEQYIATQDAVTNQISLHNTDAAGMVELTSHGAESYYHGVNTNIDWGKATMTPMGDNNMPDGRYLVEVENSHGQKETYIAHPRNAQIPEGTAGADVIMPGGSKNVSDTPFGGRAVFLEPSMETRMDLAISNMAPNMNFGYVDSLRRQPVPAPTRSEVRAFAKQYGIPKGYENLSVGKEAGYGPYITYTATQTDASGTKQKVNYAITASKPNKGESEPIYGDGKTIIGYRQVIAPNKGPQLSRPRFGKNNGMFIRNNGLKTDIKNKPSKPSWR